MIGLKLLSLSLKDLLHLLFKYGIKICEFQGCPVSFLPLKSLERLYFKSANILTRLKGHAKSNSMNTKIKMIIGMALIGFAFVFMIGVAYFIDQRNQESLQEISALQVELANNVAEKAQDYLSKNDLEKINREPIRLADVLAKAEIIYGQQELNRKDGVLWIDRKSSSLMITLGAVNGLVPGTYLSVYKERRQSNGTIINEPIDDVIVEKSSKKWTIICIPTKMTL